MIEGSILFEDAPVLPSEHGIRILPGDQPEPWADLWRIFHPAPQTVPPPKRTQTGEGSKPLPTATFWETWVTGPLSRGAASIGSFFTAPLRALKTTGLWLGGGLIVVAVVAVIGLVIVLRIVRTVEGR